MADLRQLMTLRQHYYPEGGWGWVLVVVAFIVQCLSHGLQLSFGILLLHIGKKIDTLSYTMIGTSFTVQSVLLFINHFYQFIVYIGSISMAVGLFFSPITIALCKRKSTRLIAVIGGLVTALGCLFTSFASQYHQMLFSYGSTTNCNKSLNFPF